MKDFSIIVCMEGKRGIGKNGRIPWANLSRDMLRFKKITVHCDDPNKKNAVIMGRRTWESLPERFRPLPDRINVVVTSQPRENILGSASESLQKAQNDVVVMKDLDEALKIFDAPAYRDKVENVFVIGGGQIYEEALKRKNCKMLYVTHVDIQMSCDTFFPALPDHFKLQKKSEELKDGNRSFYFAEYARINA